MRLVCLLREFSVVQCMYIYLLIIFTIGCTCIRLFLHHWLGDTQQYCTTGIPLQRHTTTANSHHSVNSNELPVVIWIISHPSS